MGVKRPEKIPDYLAVAFIIIGALMGAIYKRLGWTFAKLITVWIFLCLLYAVALAVMAWYYTRNILKLAKMLGAVINED